MENPKLCSCYNDGCSGVSLNINPHSRDDCELCRQPIKLGVPYLYLHRYRGTQGAQTLKCHEECLVNQKINVGSQKQDCIFCGEKDHHKNHFKIDLNRRGSSKMTLHQDCLKQALALSRQERKEYCLKAKNPSTKTMALFTFGAESLEEKKDLQKYKKGLEITILLEDDLSRATLLKNADFHISQCSDYCLKIRTRLGQSTGSKQIEVNVTEAAVTVRYPDTKVVEEMKKILNEKVILSLYCKYKYQSDLESSVALLLTEDNPLIRKRFNRLLEKENKNIVL